MKTEKQVIRIKNLTTEQFQEFGVFMEMSAVVGREYVVWKSDGEFVEIIARYKMILPVTVVEFIGIKEVNGTKYAGASETSKKIYSYKERTHLIITKGL